MTEDEIRAWFFKYGQYANGKDMALIKAIEAAIKPQRTWVGLTDEELKPICDEYRILFGSWVEDFARAIETKFKEKNT